MKTTYISIALTLAAAGAAWAPAFAQNPQTTPTGRSTAAVVLPFVVASGQNYDDRASLACPSTDQLSPQDIENLRAAEAAGLAQSLTDELKAEVQSAGGIQLYEHRRSAPGGAMIVAGCLIKADPGNARERLIGMGMGASRLTAHVQVFRKDAAGPQLTDEFTLEAVGENKLPPLGAPGLIMHKMKGRKETLTADAGKLAKLIAKRALTGPGTAAPSAAAPTSPSQ
jgi:hypothetical protein